MKNVFRMFVVIFISVLSFTSCEKEDENFEQGLVRTDNPPKQMFVSDIEFGTYYSVFLEKKDIDQAIFYGSFQSGSSSNYDEQTGVRREVISNSDYFKISGKKFFGTYHYQMYVSQSSDFFLISSYDMNLAKETIGRKGSANVWVGSREIDYRWRTISGVQ